MLISMRDQQAIYITIYFAFLRPSAATIPIAYCVAFQSAIQPIEQGLQLIGLDFFNMHWK